MIPVTWPEPRSPDRYRMHKGSSPQSIRSPRTGSIISDPTPRSDLIRASTFQDVKRENLMPYNSLLATVTRSISLQTWIFNRHHLSTHNPACLDM